MRIVTRKRHLLQLACIVSSLVCTGAWSAPPRPRADALDQINRPARSSTRVAASLFLAITRAGERLVAVGERGFVLLSDDGGRQWRQARNVPVSVTLTNVQFVSAGVGWAVGHGGVVLHSRDGGENWVRQLDGQQAAERILEETLAEANSGAERAKQALREAERLVADGPDKPFLGLYFRDERRGWVVGAYGLALTTDDGGQSWHSLMTRIANPLGKHLNDIRPSEASLVIAGEQGSLFRSDDGGEHFVAVSTPYAGSYFGTVSGLAGDFVAYGLRGNAYRRVDGWASWQKVELGQDVTVTAGARLADGSMVLADETGRVLRSDDGGRHFVILPTTEARSFTSIAQAPDGALVLSGMGGITRIEPDLLALEPKQ